MKHLLSFLLLLFTGLDFAQAQDYFPIRKGQTFYYETVASDTVWTKELTGYHIDSVYEEAGDSVFASYPVFLMNPTDPSCFHLGNGLSQRMIQKEDGRFAFQNYEDDWCYLQPDAGQGTSWHFYDFSDGEYIEALVETLRDTLILGANDTVKVIRLQRKKAGGQNTNDPINQERIYLSKSWGLLSTIIFYNYPHAITSMTLIGAELAPAGFKVPTNGEIYDFEVGDVFHYENYWSDTYRYSVAGKINEGWTKLEVLEKNTAVAWEVTYTFWEERHEKQTYFEYGETRPAEYVDEAKLLTETYSGLDSAVIDRFRPGLAVPEAIGAEGNWYPETMRAGWNRSWEKWEVRANEGSWIDLFGSQAGGDCYGIAGALYHWGATDRYLPGFGKVLDAFLGGDSEYQNAWHTRLAYYNKSGQEWGRTVSTNELSPHAKHISLFPNPTNGWLNVNQIPNDVSFWVLVDVQGKVVREGQVDGSGNMLMIDLSVLFPGIYFLQMRGPQTTMTRKVIRAANP